MGNTAALLGRRHAWRVLRGTNALTRPPPPWYVRRGRTPRLGQWAAQVVPQVSARCFYYLLGAIKVLRKVPPPPQFDPHPPPRNANNIELYMFVTLFSGNLTHPTPTALRNTCMAPYLCLGVTVWVLVDQPCNYLATGQSAGRIRVGTYQVISVIWGVVEHQLFNWDFLQITLQCTT